MYRRRSVYNCNMAFCHIFHQEMLSVGTVLRLLQCALDTDALPVNTPGKLGSVPARP